MCLGLSLGDGEPRTSLNDPNSHPGSAAESLCDIRQVTCPLEDPVSLPLKWGHCSSCWAERMDDTGYQCLLVHRMNERPLHSASCWNCAIVILEATEGCPDPLSDRFGFEF